MSPALDIPKGVTTHIAYAETNDNVVGVSGIRREKSKMRRACFCESEGGPNVTLLPLKGTPCSVGVPSVIQITLGRNHECIRDLLKLNI